MGKAAALFLNLLLAGCTVNLSRIQDPPRSVAVTTTTPWNSMMYLARTDSGVVVIDLGWAGGEGKLREGLRRIGAQPGDVRHVFLTHTHRDHIVGWRLLRHARFHLAAPETALFRGARHHADFPSSAAERLIPSARPRAGELEVREFVGDATFYLGRDTVLAFSTPGHTAGSAAYLFRGVLFVGDAVTYTPLIGFRSAKRIYTDDPGRSRSSVAALWKRVEQYRVDWVCTAHGKCSRFTEEFRRDALR